MLISKIQLISYSGPSLDQNEDWINAQNITDYDLSSILIRCPNIKYLYLCDCFITVSTLEWLVSQLQQIKCLSLIAINGINCGDWNRIWCALSERKLTHFTLSDNHFADIDITKLIESSQLLEELHLAYYRQSLSELFIRFGKKISKLSLIECFRTNLVAMKALVNGNGINITELVVHKVPTYDENILSEFICLKMPQLIKFSYAFDSQVLMILIKKRNKKSFAKVFTKLLFYTFFKVPHIQPIEYLVNLEQLSLLSNEEYGLDIASLLTKVMPTVKYLRLNAHFDSKMLRNLDELFPNIETLEFSFDRICCNCTTIGNNQNNNGLNNNPNNNAVNNQLNNANANNENNNLIQENNFVDELNDNEPYLDDNCLICSEKCVLIFSKLQKLKVLKLNGERIKDSALKALEFCDKLNTIIIDKNCKEFNLKLLLITFINLAKNTDKQLITVKISEKYYSRIINIKNMPKKFRILRH